MSRVVGKKCLIHVTMLFIWESRALGTLPCPHMGPCYTENKRWHGGAPYTPKNICFSKSVSPISTSPPGTTLQSLSTSSPVSHQV